VEYKGGCCSICGYNRYIGSLEFHHVNAEGKDFTLAHAKNTVFEKIKAELDKCVVLCANCHREEHARLKALL
jgi:5-methylcytosine-specific restriction endonuclease McrA